MAFSSLRDNGPRGVRCIFRVNINGRPGPPTTGQINVPFCCTDPSLASIITFPFTYSLYHTFVARHGIKV